MKRIALHSCFRPLGRFPPRTTIFVGPAFTRNVNQRLNAFGWQAELAGYFSRHFGVVVGGSGVYGKFPPVYDTSTYSFFAGPQVRFPTRTRVTPFVRAAVRASHWTAGYSGYSSSTNRIGIGVGGGVDARVTPHVSIRAVQTDDSILWVDGNHQRGFEISVGMVFMFQESLAH